MEKLVPCFKSLVLFIYFQLDSNQVILAALCPFSEVSLGVFGIILVKYPPFTHLHYPARWQQMPRYSFSFILPSITWGFPVLYDEKQPDTKIIPPPNYTVSYVFLRWCAVSFVLPTWCLSFSQFTVGLIWPDYRLPVFVQTLCNKL